MAATLLLSPHLPRQFLITHSRPPPIEREKTSSLRRRSTGRLLRTHAIQETQDKETDASSSAEEVTKKYGLEFGLWQIFREKGAEGGMKKKSKADEAKELLAKYGGAYLATSITLSLISFSLCYLLVTAGIDVQSLLGKVCFYLFLFSNMDGLIEMLQVGIAVDETGEKVGTFALAYAAHKAASPIRFPPTVALTPIVAGWIGKKTAGKDEK